MSKETYKAKIPITIEVNMYVEAESEGDIETAILNAIDNMDQVFLDFLNGEMECFDACESHYWGTYREDWCIRESNDEKPKYYVDDNGELKEYNDE